MSGGRDLLADLVILDEAITEQIDKKRIGKAVEYTTRDPYWLRGLVRDMAKYIRMQRQADEARRR